VPLADAPAEAYFRIQGFQLVPGELSELWAEVRGLDSPSSSLVLAAMGVKLLGIFANVWRWQILLRGRASTRLRLSSPDVLHRALLRHRHAEHDGTRRVAALRDDPAHAPAGRVHHRARRRARARLVGLFTRHPPLHAVRRAHHAGQSLRRAGRRDEVPLVAASTLFAVSILLQPELVPRLLRLVPARRRASRQRRSTRRPRTPTGAHLVLALASPSSASSRRRSCTSPTRCRSATQNVHASEVLFASAVMTFGTFVAPSASGEGVRELVFVWLLGSQDGRRQGVPHRQPRVLDRESAAVRPGGLILLLRRDPSLHAVTRRTWSASVARPRPKRGPRQVDPRRTSVETDALHWRARCV
jgi:hypothetical protein